MNASSIHLSRSPKFAALALFLALAASTGGAQPGSAGFPLLKLGPSASGTAMADAMTASAQGASATVYNPAGLAPDTASGSAEIMFTHREWVQDTRLEYLLASVNLDGVSSVGIALHTASIEDIEVRTRPGPAEGTFTARYAVLSGSYAYMFSDAFRAGLSAKFLYEKLLVDDASGFAFDLGVHWHPSIAGLRVGAALTDVGSMGTLRSEPTRVPAALRLGSAYAIDLPVVPGRATVEGDVMYRFAESRLYPALGGEFLFNGMFAARAGYQFGSDGRGFAAGLGVRYGVILLDYAYAPVAEGLGNTHTLSLGIAI